MEGIEHGFRIGFTYECKQAKTNMKSALDNPSVVDKYLATEVKMGRIFGPLEAEILPMAHISHFGVIPKNHQPGK